MTKDDFTTRVVYYIDILVSKFIEKELYYDIIEHQEEYISNENMTFEIIDGEGVQVVHLERYMVRFTFMIMRFINSESCLAEREELFGLYQGLNQDYVLLMMIIFTISDLRGFRLSFLIEEEYINLFFKLKFDLSYIRKCLSTAIMEGTE